jgi:hypothetical protein
MQPSLLQKPKIKKPKLLRSNPYRLSVIRFWGVDSYEILIDDEDILVNSRRIVGKTVQDDEELSDYVNLRLLMIRNLAMSKYREIYQQA